MFPLSQEREHNFVAGLSMGGYGAFKIGLTFPERFAAVASMSGVLDIDLRWREQEAAGNGRPYRMAFGDEPVAGTEDDIFHLFHEAIASKQPLPKLYQCCGTEDFLYEGNLNFRKLALKHPKLDYTYNEGPGAHTWDYWDEHIQKVIKWLPIK
jgi:S-formylglutathione hydrolase FrmB